MTSKGKAVELMVSDDVKRQLCALARSSRTRTAVFNPSRPTHWAPYEVRCPDSGDTFTADSAWHFVADMIEGGAEMETISLAKPAGKTGYVMIVEGFGGEKIYIKLQLGSGQVIGRSFHISVNEDQL
ncbi:hypothetical protein [Sphingobium limneticum]|nr:hypothetical protein [Sphingobium limneticum]